MNKPDSPYRAKLKTFTILKVAESQTLPESPISTPAAAAGYLLPFFQASDAGREHFAVLFLNAKHHPIAAKVLFSGSSSETAVYPREIARAAVLVGASALVIAHNHPTGDLTPSAEDICLTRRVQDGLRLLDIRLLDSLVIDEDGRYIAINKT